MIVTCIVAGGSGTRMGQAVPKQFLPLLGEPVLVHTVRRFWQMSDLILVGVPPAYVQQTRQLLPWEKVQVLEGGKTRMETVQRLAAALQCADSDVVLTHDAVRPFVSSRMLWQSVEQARRVGVCGVFVPCVDTIAVSQDGKRLQSVPPRRSLYQVQTPQTFLYGMLKQLLPHAHDGLTDLCGLAAEQGQPVAMVEGAYTNIKITHPEDLVQAEQICRRYFPIEQGGDGNADWKRI